MKRFLSLSLCVIMLAVVLVGCPAPSGLPAGMNGTDAAKLLFANGRLDAALFRGGDNLFDSGAAAFAHLSAVADSNLENVSYSALTVQADAPFTYSDEKRGGEEGATPPAGDGRHTAKDGSYVEIKGNTFYWKNFAEYSNSYDYFANITGNVKSSAELGAQLIDDIKSYVRVIDKWVDVGGDRYYLHVEEDTEIIYHITHDGHKSICMRTKRADGTNVYELYWQNEIGASRMIYIPGEKCEYSFQPHDGGNHDFLAESKLQQGIDKKRKAKTTKKMDHPKKRRTNSVNNTTINGGTNVTSSQLISSILPTSDVSDHNILTNCNKTREEKRTEVEHCTHGNQAKGTLSSSTAFEQSHSFNKSYTEDIFPMTPPELEETIRDEKIRRLKQVLREKEAALEEMRKKMHQK